MDKEGSFSAETKETKEALPIPNTLDLVCIDGKFAQYLGGGDGLSLVFIDDKTSGHINQEALSEYVYEAPSDPIVVALDLVKQGLMTQDQLQKVHWGPEQEQHPYLRGYVTFFGTYTKKARNTA